MIRHESDDDRIIVSSGNVFRDLGRPDPELLLFKAKLAAQVSDAITRRSWTQIEAASHLGVDQPRVSHLMRGHLSGFSTDALLGFLKRLDVTVNVTIDDPVVAAHDKCGDVKPLSEAKVSHEGGNATYVCADCYSEFE